MASIKCPACQSEIGADGKSLVERSPYLTELEQAADAFEKRLAQIERERKAEKKEHVVESVARKKKGRKPERQAEREPERERGGKPWWKRSS